MQYKFKLNEKCYRKYKKISFMFMRRRKTCVISIIDTNNTIKRSIDLSTRWPSEQLDRDVIKSCVRISDIDFSILYYIKTTYRKKCQENEVIVQCNIVICGMILVTTKKFSLTIIITCQRNTIWILQFY